MIPKSYSIVTHHFERFGFHPAPNAVLPGPVDRRRVMWLPITEVAPVGAVRPVA